MTSGHGFPRLDELSRGGKSLHETGTAIRHLFLFLDGECPGAVIEAIVQAYRDLSQRAGVDKVALALLRTATAEDLREASFAGQQETFLNVRGDRTLLDARRRCFAPLFADRTIVYREIKGVEHMQVALSICAQRIVRADLAG